MPAYLVGGVDVSDPAWVAEYGPKVEALVEKHGGRYLVRGGEMDVVEGTTPAGRVMVVVEFPSLEAARDGITTPPWRPPGHGITTRILRYVFPH